LYSAGTRAANGTYSILRRESPVATFCISKIEITFDNFSVAGLVIGLIRA
jgi:hypothetical protein